MNKPSFVISCPYDTYSGYGARARDIVKSIIELDKYDVKLLSQKWGNTPLDFCAENDEWSYLNNLRIPGIQNGQKPDVWMQITIPTEFAPVGKFNIGCTAGIESTGCAAPWVEGLNRMDINFVSSEHSKKVFEDIKFEKRNKQTNVVEGVVKLEKPIEVIFEGFNEDTYKYLKPSEISLDLSEIKDQFNFLFV